MRERLRPFVAIALLLLAGCASARMSDHASDRLFREGRYDEAAKKLEEGLKDQGENGRDQLLYLLDLGLSLHAAGKYEESNKVFLRADKIAEIKDYTSLATESATLLTSDNIKDYKGEDFEKVLINTYLAINYALMGNYDDALVEARRVNRKLYMMVTDGQRKYKQNAFARYLSAVLYEAEGNSSDAYIDYKETYKLLPSYPGLGRDLWRTAKLNKMDDEMEKWDDEYHLTPDDHKEAMQSGPKSGKGEIVVIYQNGISPIKRPNPQFSSIPKFYPRFNPVSQAMIDVLKLEAEPGAPSSDAPSTIQALTAQLHNIETTAIENLDEKYGGLIAKKIAGVVAKEVVADQIGKRTDPLIGFLAKVAFYASDQADVRSWNLLPHDLQMARIPVVPGTYVVKASAIGAGQIGEKTVQVAKGQKVFLSFRYIPR